MVSAKNSGARCLLYLLIGSLVLFPIFAWETDRNMVRRWVYPAKGLLSSWATQCSTGSPQWMPRLINELATDYASPANQLAFLSATGELKDCASGWSGLPLASDRVQHDTRFRLASLSKIVSFVALARKEVVNGQQWLDRSLVVTLSLDSTSLVDPRVADIRIRHLLNHSAGFDRLRSVDTMVVRDKRPWCPYHVEQLSKVRLDFAPGGRYAYANLGHCLAALAFEKQFGKSLWSSLEEDLHIRRYGLDYLDQADSKVTFNFMHNEFYDSSFTQYFDWYALRGSMGLTGNARGLAQFIRDNRALLEFSRTWHSDQQPECKETQAEGCFDGFLERRRLPDGSLLWNQKGYLYGMSAMLLTDEHGNTLVWLGSGDTSTPGVTYDHVQQSFWQALH